MSVPDPAQQEYRNPPLTIAGRSFFDGIRFRWGGVGAILLGVSVIGGLHSGGAIVFGILFILLGITTWILTSFGRRSWWDLSTASRAIAGTGSVIGMLFLYLVFFYFFIIRLVWRHIIKPGL